MTFVKAEDGERISAIDGTGRTVAYIEKQRLGTHGYWKGYLHYTFCEKLEKLIWAGVDERMIYPDKPYEPLKSWTAAPPWFPSVKEFKAYYSE